MQPRRWVDGNGGSNGPLAGSELQFREDGGRSLEADQVTAERTVVGRIRGRTIRVHQGATALALGRDIQVRQGGGGVLAGAKLTVEQGAGQWLVGGLVQARQVFAVAVIAGRIDGQVRCLFDARGAFAFGAGAALMTGVLRLLLRKR
ncbi:MAG: hypothetical protein ACRDI2_23880 [Chloroflexota bacterium]